MRRKTAFRAGLAGLTAAVCYATAAEVKRSSPVQLQGMLLLAAGGLIGMATNSVMARTAQSRITTTVMPMLATHTTAIAATTSVANAASTSVGNVVSGATYVPNADYSTDTTHIYGVDGGFVSGQTSMFTGSESVPGTVGPFGTGDALAAFIGSLNANFVTPFNNLATVVQYIQSELNAHGFSSN